MSKKSKYGKVNQEELLRYIHGEMTDEERHFLERELQKDLFASEALEGLSTQRIEQVREDLDKLENRLNKRVKGSQSVMWIRIAASVAILLTIGTVYFTVFTDMLDRTDRMAVETEPIEESRAKSDLTGPEVTLKEVEAEQDEVSESRILEKSDEQKPVSGAVVQESLDDQAESETRSQEEIVLADQVVEPVSDAGSETLESENIELEPTISEPETIIALADTIGLLEEEFELAEENVLPAEEPAEELAYEVTAVQSAARSSGIAQPSALREAPAASKKQASAISRQVKPLAVIISDSIFAQPVIGMDSFREFIADNMRMPEGEFSEEEVILSFGVSNSGRPQDLEVIESSGESFSSEAMRLLQVGPDWTPVLKNGIPSQEKIRLRINLPEQ